MIVSPWLKEKKDLVLELWAHDGVALSVTEVIALYVPQTFLSIVNSILNLSIF